MKAPVVIAVSLLLATTLAGCGPTPNDRAASGAVIGGATGALIGGAATGKAGGAVVGGVLGAATGAVIGGTSQPAHGWAWRCVDWGYDAWGNSVCLRRARVYY
ncbi:hypothetical protein [Methylovirgula sp. 4M-Z18]|uniref:hypothetical protein n=1 Tax=Methylovirgula sp. 4M-Z18 TaxID=2293567 RepID=UPI000E2F0785|nr:hypothetical protein [Methylovirgula sp. 4M-Z18]RFB79621.1 hypothetical protein DYH55_09010 [Methylovirgula sp. 4M-Z18]